MEGCFIHNGWETKPQEAPNMRWVLKHIAHENNINLSHTAKTIKLPDGNMWSVSKI